LKGEKEGVSENSQVHSKNAMCTCVIRTNRGGFEWDEAGKINLKSEKGKVKVVSLKISLGKLIIKNHELDRRANYDREKEKFYYQLKMKFLVMQIFDLI
jgi:hypothetical protein